MSTYLSNVVEDDTITCGVCNKTFITDEFTVDDWNFAWDNRVHTDCCNDCSSKVLVKQKEDSDE